MGVDTEMAAFEITYTVDHDSFLEFVSTFNSETEKQFSQFKGLSTNEIEFKVFNSGRLNFFLKLEGRLAGYAFLVHKNHHVVNFGLVITPIYQRLGYGPLLLRYLINWARNAGYKKIWGACFDDNETALRLYKKLGFRFEGIFLNEEKTAQDGKETYRHLYSLAMYFGRNEGSSYEYFIDKFKNLYENL